MVRRKRTRNVTQRGQLATALGRRRSRRPERSRRAFRFERLEDRLLMTASGGDGPGFVHNPYVPPPDPVVGQATITAVNDYSQAYNGSTSNILNVLTNDSGPNGQSSLRITSVSETLLGSDVTISADGKSLVYAPAAVTTPFIYGGDYDIDPSIGYDSFYYIVEDGAGNISKANVSVTILSRLHGPINDMAWGLEDEPSLPINVLSNDRDFADGTIVAVSDTVGHGAVRIADDGRSVIYSPTAHFHGTDSFSYSVRNAAGDIGMATVSVFVQPRFEAVSDWYLVDVNSREVQLNVLRDDTSRGTPLSPQIESVSPLEVGGSLRIADDGQSVLFAPAREFIGNLSFQYTVRYGEAALQTSTATVSLQVIDPFLVVNNWFTVDPDSSASTFDVLANDPILADCRDVSGPMVRHLQITAMSAGSAGGQIAVSDDGQHVVYAPAAGFRGDEKFSYTVSDETGFTDSATVTVHVAPPAADPFNLPRFREAAELEQWLLDQAVEQYKWQFGVESQRYRWKPNENGDSGTSTRGPVVYPAGVLVDEVYVNSLVRTYAANVAGGPDHSETNVQHAGIDEADVVETDGNYLYAFSAGQLVIVDVGDLTHPALVSVTHFDAAYTEMYLQGERLTLVDRGNAYGGTAEVAVLDVSDRAKPTLLERTEIDGQIVDSRAIGDRVYLVTQRGLQLPPPETHIVSETPSEDGSGSLQQVANETLDQYLARVSGHLAELSLPMFHTYNGAGELVASGLLSQAEQIHKPLSAADCCLLSVVTIDVGDNVAGPVTSTGLFTDAAQQIYVSQSGVYVLRPQYDRYWFLSSTQILKFAFESDGTTSLEAAGSVAGTVKDQFSLDESGGQLRVVTTTVSHNLLSQVLQRQNDLFVLQQVGTQLAPVGGLENFAPTETVKSVRFAGDRAYICTFRVIDPLFAIDLSEPATPRIAGAIHIPGFSDYLQPIGEDYVLGFGQDANDITGALGTAQVSLFYVGDIDNPQLVDRMTLDGAEGISSEAFVDHHAIAYFAEHHVLSIPISWQSSTDVDSDGDGITDYESYETHSAAFVFRFNVDQSASGGIEYTGRVEHDSQVHRSVRIGDALVTISSDGVKINDINHPHQEICNVYLGPLPTDDTFNVTEDSGANALDVLANDHLGVGGQPPAIVSVTQPTRPIAYGYWGYQPVDAGAVGTVAISADGKSIIFTPAKDFFGTATFTYTVSDPLHGEETATVTLNVANVPDNPTAVDDEFTVAPDAGPTHLSVLNNDANVDSPTRQAPYLSITSIDRISYVDLVADTLVAPGKAAVVPSSIASDTSIGSVWRGDDFVLQNPFVPTDWLPIGLTITAVGPTDHGGAVEIGENGRDLVYTPAAGFAGVETFTYMVTNEAGRSATATVTVRVGTAPASALAPTMDARSLSAIAEPARDVATQIAFSLSAATSPSESLRGGMSAGLLSAAIDSTASLRQTALNLLSQQLFNSPAARHGFAATDNAIAELTSSDGEHCFAGVGHLLDDLAESLVASPAGTDQLSF
jgi:uncharacterized secreted protein with C-terminal beta-propeller domain